MWAPCATSTDATTSLPPLQEPQPQQQQQQQQQPTVGESSLGEAKGQESLGAASFQAQQANRDPEGTAESFPSLQGLGEAPALFQQDAESFSNQGGAPAYRMYSEKSVSNSASSSEEHVSSKHKLSEVLIKLSIMATCLQEYISTMVELQSDSFNQQEDAHLGTRESSFRGLDLLQEHRQQQQ